MRVHYIQDYGSYLQMLTPLISQLTLLMSPGAYAIPEIDVKVTNVYTNTVPTDALRGAGRPEATHAIERTMDVLAKKVGISRPRCAGATSPPSSRSPARSGSSTTRATTKRRSTSCSR